MFCLSPSRHFSGKEEQETKEKENNESKGFGKYIHEVEVKMPDIGDDIPGGFFFYFTFIIVLYWAIEILGWINHII